MDRLSAAALANNLPSYRSCAHLPLLVTMTPADTHNPCCIKSGDPAGDQVTAQGAYTLGESE